MGFDIIGKGTTEKGKYFRNNCWGWRPLWGYVCKVCPDIITEEEQERGEYNDGYLINADKAKRIAIRLTHLLRQGEVSKYAKEYKEAIKKLPDEVCPLCKGTGKRDDKVVKGKCNGCDGKGKRKPWAASYPFHVSNVREFAEFCRESNGFEIW